MDKCYAAYCKYYATGEGVTTVLAVAGAPEQVRRHFDEHAPEFFAGRHDCRVARRVKPRSCGAYRPHDDSGASAGNPYKKSARDDQVLH